MARSPGVEAPASSVDPPAENGAFAPRWGVADGSPVLSWLEPLEDGHRLRFARLESEGWSAPTTVAEGTDFFANWADTPGVAETPTGELRAHWLQKTSDETYSYSIALARSSDGGRSWTRDGFLNQDETLTEHGFVSTAIDGSGALSAIWLDGREMATGGSMTLRAVSEGEPSQILDARVCECCPTAVVACDGGLVAAYRDRSSEEVRDISIARKVGAEWVPSKTLHDDAWSIDGCPVNGPALAASGERVLVAWFTGSGERPRVMAAWSSDRGETFSAPVPIDDAAPIGRVGATWSGDSGAISWLGRDGDDAVVYLQSISTDGQLGLRLEVARTEASRRSGVPVLGATPTHLLVAWTEALPDSALQLRVRRVPRSRLL